MAFLFIGRLA